MGDKTGISWTDATWNPVRGCSRVSEGCRNCYAEQQAGRIVRMAKGKPSAYDGLVRILQRSEDWARWTGEVALDPKTLAQPLRWKKPRRVFVNSMSDLFHESLTNEQIAAVFGVMAAAPQHTFQILTKRARRMREWFEWVTEYGRSAIWAEAKLQLGEARDFVGDDVPWPLPNVWLGVSVENQEAADERIPELLRTPAAVRFLSCEPLLGKVLLDNGVHSYLTCTSDAAYDDPPADHYCCDAYADHGEHFHGIDWVIAGCESGPDARVCKVDWLRSLRDQCAAAGVPYFLKQAVELRGGDGASGDAHQIAMHRGSKRKAGNVIELPALDGEQHAAFPEVSP